MEKRKKDMDKELEKLRDMAGRLEESMDEEEAIELIEETVEQIEKCGKSLEEEG